MSALRAAWQQYRAGIAQLRLWWSQRALRERRLLGLAVVVVGAALLWGLVVRPAWDSVRQSVARLPVLHAQAAQVQALLLEAQALQRRQIGRIEPDTLAEALQASLRRAGLDTMVTIDNAGDAPPGQWRVAVQDANAARLMEWLAQLAPQLQLRIQQLALARAQRDGRVRPGNVSGHIVLRVAQEVP